MRILTSAVIATTMLALAGCSTTAVNPNYQQTTKYKGSNPYANQAPNSAEVQNANYQTQRAAPVTYIGQQVAPIPMQTVPGQTVPGQKMVRQSVPVYQSVPQTVTYEAPRVEQGLQENTTSLGENGTPGYYAVNGTPPPVQATQPQFAQTQSPQPQQMQAEPSPMPTTFAPIPLPPSLASSIPASLPSGTIRHTVIPGDTLYSLARTTCSSVTEIQNINTINDEFYIRAGEDILLPNGRCVE
ncbi:MAG: LysM peptidoglycan-binding domain-containing protein [Robiginitomaculum sp.]|nr:LysM peptidoglycan-binding domain-containing protein [Robiginitomaculum sp.]